MSSLAATQIPKPADEQAFERASVVLWRSILRDPSVQRNGRRGQAQNGVDLFGVRNQDSNHIVGIQCKLKGEGHKLTEAEIREEVSKALNFQPPLKEYYITTTAPDDALLQEAARKITIDIAASGKCMRVSVWGWNTLEEYINDDAASRRAFDPDYTPILNEFLGELRGTHQNSHESILFELRSIKSKLNNNTGLHSDSLSDSTVEKNRVEAQLDAEIDGYRDLTESGKILVAMPFLEKLLARVADSASGRILFRNKANIGHCLLALGKDDEAAATLLAAYAHAPTEPKAIANKALSLLIRGNWQELLAFGKLELERDPTNEWLAGYVVQAAHFDNSLSDPLILVPEQLHGTASVQIGWVDFLRRRGAYGSWWAPAHQVRAVHSAEPWARRFAAEADLEEILSNPEYQRTRILSPSQQKKLKEVIETLEPQWERHRDGDGPLSQVGISLCANLILSFCVLSKHSQALDIARQGLRKAPHDMDLITRAAEVAFNVGDDELASRLIPELPETSDGLILKFRFYAAKAAWAELASLLSCDLSIIPASENQIFLTTARLAKIEIETTTPEERQRQTSVLAAEAASDPRASIVIAEFARRQQMDDIADAAYQSAIKLINDRSHIADRFMVAQHASRRREPAAVVDLLAGHVPEYCDSPELRMLTRAYVNDVPIRSRAVSFFARLPRELRDLPFYQEAEGLLHCNRGALREAAAVLRKAAAAKPHLDIFLSLLAVLQRLDLDEEMKAVVDAIDLENAAGSAAQKIALAQIMQRIGYGTKALQYAYSVLKSARNDQDAVLRYFGLVMAAPDEGVVPATDEVALDTWVRLDSDDGLSHAFLIEDEEDRPADGVLSSSHPMSKAALGRKLGDVFQMPIRLGGIRNWRITEIKHKFLYALHDAMENFENRFPDSTGFYRIRSKDGDIKPALDIIRRRAESQRKFADLYIENRVPLSVAAANANSGTIGFAEYIRFLGLNLRSCLGTNAERQAAGDLLSKNLGSVAILDAYTAWTVSTMDAFDVLQSVFSDLILPQSALDEIKSLRDETDVTEPSIIVTWHNGEFLRQEITRDESTTRYAFITEQIEQIEKNCDIRPAQAPDHPTKLAELINSSISSYVLDAANLASNKHILVSEDLHYRQYAEAACGAIGVWLQPLFSFAHEHKLIDFARYVDLSIKLAFRRHGHLTVSPELLMQVFFYEETEELESFNAVAHFIGTSDADITSHIDVVLSFLNDLWREKSIYDSRRLHATSTLLMQLIRFRDSDWPYVIAYLHQFCLPPLQKYIAGWIVGHFLPSSRIADAIAELSSIKADLLIRRN